MFLDRLARRGRCGIFGVVTSLLLSGALAPALAKDKKSAAKDEDALAAALAGKSPQERVEYLNGIVEDGKASRDVYFQLGNARYESGDPAKAAIAFQQAVAMDSTFFKAIVNLGLMYDEQQMYPKAIEVFEQATHLQPDNPDVWSHMGNTYYAQNNFSKATELYRKAIALDPKATHAIYSFAVAFADAGLFREAVKYWQQVVQLDPQSEIGKNAAENVELVQKYLIP